jgi:hypothetical protein
MQVFIGGILLFPPDNAFLNIEFPRTVVVTVTAVCAANDLVPGPLVLIDISPVTVFNGCRGDPSALRGCIERQPAER